MFAGARQRTTPGRAGPRVGSACFDVLRHTTARAVLALVCFSALSGARAGNTAAAPPDPPNAPAPATSVPQDSEPAAGLFLVASRALDDPFFRRSVILVLNSDANGTQGLVVNRKLHVRLSEALPDLDKKDGADNQPVFFGGPLSLSQFFLLTRESVPQTQAFPIADQLYFSSDRHVLDTLLARRTPEDELHLYLGYTGWGPGQLGIEILRGSWHLVKVDPATIFEQPVETLWNRLIDEAEPSGIEVRYRPDANTREYRSSRSAQDSVQAAVGGLDRPASDTGNRIGL